jgi:bifunctional DNA-binding transcriptional regulator/antitoxin component of YhaV-PrlF toxin-antitoxin module
MQQTTYHKRKIYVPDEIAEKLGLKDGDKVQYSIQGDDIVNLKIERKSSAKNLLLRELQSPKPIRAKRPIRRRAIYEDAH